MKVPPSPLTGGTDGGETTPWPPDEPDLMGYVVMGIAEGGVQRLQRSLAGWKTSQKAGASRRPYDQLRGKPPLHTFGQTMGIM